MPPRFDDSSVIWRPPVVTTDRVAVPVMVTPEMELTDGSEPAADDAMVPDGADALAMDGAVLDGTEMAACEANVPDGTEMAAFDANEPDGTETPALAANEPDGTDTSAPEAWVWVTDASEWSGWTTVSAACDNAACVRSGCDATAPSWVSAVWLRRSGPGALSVPSQNAQCVGTVAMVPDHIRMPPIGTTPRTEPSVTTCESEASYSVPVRSAPALALWVMDI